MIIHKWKNKLFTFKAQDGAKIQEDSNLKEKKRQDLHLFFILEMGWGIGAITEPEAAQFR